MKNFFRALERRRVRYLLISGQATVLYGASTFSEDVDIWVSPTAANWRRLRAALADSQARVYKLTPPLTLPYARRGHGFHFTLMPELADDPPAYLDVMAVVPRCRRFAACYRRARRFTTIWGKLPVIHPFDLAQIKYTRRLTDYDIISTLARQELRRHRSRAVWRWAVKNTFDAEQRRQLWQSAPLAWRQHLRPPDLTTAGVAQEIEQLREADRLYWQPVVAELKKLQREGRLMRAGAVVTP